MIDRRIGDVTEDDRAGIEGFGGGMARFFGGMCCRFGVLKHLT